MEVSNPKVGAYSMSWQIFGTPRGISDPPYAVISSSGARQVLGQPCLDNIDKHVNVPHSATCSAWSQRSD
jgi:hypothetical protein